MRFRLVEPIGKPPGTAGAQLGTLSEQPLNIMADFGAADFSTRSAPFGR